MKYKGFLETNPVNRSNGTWGRSGLRKNNSKKAIKTWEKWVFISRLQKTCWFPEGDSSCLFLYQNRHLRPSSGAKPTEGCSRPSQLWGSMTRMTSCYHLWLVVGPPLWKIWKSIGMMNFPIYGKIKLMFQTTNQICFMWETTGLELDLLLTNAGCI